MPRQQACHLVPARWVANGQDQPQVGTMPPRLQPGIHRRRVLCRQGRNPPQDRPDQARNPRPTSGRPLRQACANHCLRNPPGCQGLRPQGPEFGFDRDLQARPHRIQEPLQRPRHVQRGQTRLDPPACRHVPPGDAVGRHQDPMCLRQGRDHRAGRYQFPDRRAVDPDVSLSRRFQSQPLPQCRGRADQGAQAQRGFEDMGSGTMDHGKPLATLRLL